MTERIDLNMWPQHTNGVSGLCVCLSEVSLSMYNVEINVSADMPNIRFEIYMLKHHG